jgi:DNA adenine methylase
VELLRDLLVERPDAFFYVDPPYTDKGEELYLNDLAWQDHATLASVLTASGSRWLVTYNCDPRIPAELYPDHRCVEFDIKHTAQRQHVGAEYAIFSHALVIGSLDGLSTGNARFVVW